MKRLSLFLATFASIALMAVALIHVGSSEVRSSPDCVLGSQPNASDLSTSPAAMRWRQGLPTHWRACLLQRN